MLLPQAHPKFESVAQLAPLLFSQALQTSEAKQPKALALGDAVTQKIIANETLGYFIGRTYLFLVRCRICFAHLSAAESCAHTLGLVPCIRSRVDVNPSGTVHTYTSSAGLFPLLLLACSVGSRLSKKLLDSAACVQVGIGIAPERLRFRQHLPNEMAHYAEDCWDAEVECSYGWVECVGLADRSAYDLRVRACTLQTRCSRSCCRLDCITSRHGRVQMALEN